VLNGSHWFHLGDAVDPQRCVELFFVGATQFAQEAPGHFVSGPIVSGDAIGFISMEKGQPTFTWSHHSARCTNIPPESTLFHGCFTYYPLFQMLHDGTRRTMSRSFRDRVFERLSGAQCETGGNIHNELQISSTNRSPSSGTIQLSGGLIVSEPYWMIQQPFIDISNLVREGFPPEAMHSTTYL
jgi:hypothetical protein